MLGHFLLFGVFGQFWDAKQVSSFFFHINLFIYILDFFLFCSFLFSLISVLVCAIWIHSLHKYSIDSISFDFLDSSSHIFYCSLLLWELFLYENSNFLSRILIIVRNLMIVRISAGFQSLTDCLISQIFIVIGIWWLCFCL